MRTLRVIEKRDKSRRYRACLLIRSLIPVYSVAAQFIAQTTRSRHKNRETASAGEGWERHPQRRAQSDGQDETTGMSSRARNEAGSRIRAVRRGGAISEGTARTAQAEDCKGRGQASFARSPHRRNATARAHGERNLHHCASGEQNLPPASGEQNLPPPVANKTCPTPVANATRSISIGKRRVPPQRA